MRNLAIHVLVVGVLQSFAMARVQDPSVATPATSASLQAIVMDVEGKARWRPSADGAWRDAKVNDLMDPGAEVRTGLKSRMTMRVGRNATLLVDAGTTMELPRVAMDGDTLRTTALVRSGRVDFKVDKVGYANDFQVVTPQTTLSVRGTGFSLATGALVGAEITGARTNMINAIEVRYVASNLQYFMSGGAESSSDRKDPVQNAWASTVGPPPVAGLIADKGQMEQQLAQGQTGNAPTNPQQAQQIVAAEANGLGGNGLIAAANQDGASDIIRQVASEVASNPSSTPPPGDFIGRLKNSVLRLELRAARTDGPNYEAAADALGGAAEALASAAAELQGSSEEAFLVLDFDGVSVSDTLAARVEDFGGLKISQLDKKYDLGLANDIRKVERWAGRDLFTKDPQGNALDAGGDGRRGVMGALANARDWSAQDLTRSNTLRDQVLAATGDSQKLQSFVELHDDPYRVWGLDAPKDGSPRPDVSPLMLALAMNEQVQRAWGQLASSVYTELGGAHAGVDARTAAVLAALQQGQFGDVSAHWEQFIADYRALANAEGTADAARALAEIDALATRAGEAVESSLSGALQSLRDAADARSYGQRELLNSQGVALLHRAATVADACQTSVMGNQGILANAEGIWGAYRDALAHLRERGVTLPEGYRTIGGNGR